MIDHWNQKPTVLLQCPVFLFHYYYELYTLHVQTLHLISYSKTKTECRTCTSPVRL